MAQHFLFKDVSTALFGTAHMFGAKTLRHVSDKEEILHRIKEALKAAIEKQMK